MTQRKLSRSSAAVKTEIRRLEAHGYQVRPGAQGTNWLDIFDERGMATQHHSLTPTEFVPRAQYLANQLTWAKEDAGRS